MPEVSLTRDGLAINGRPRYMLAGQVHYFRYPRAEWRELLLKARAGGLNTIDTVIPWNLHEPEEGVFNLADEADLPGYLDLCAELGLYAIVRPDPYICAEWENGGYPAWLTAKPNLELRVDNPVYLEATQRYFAWLLPMLAERQIGRSGSIVLCQIENEHWASGRYGHDAHQQTLADLALEFGMEVPQYTCMGATPGYAEFRNGWSGLPEKLVATRALWPENPMMVAELWSGWFDNWGASRKNHKTAARLDVTLHQLAAVGTSGFSHWMWAGGTNFGYWGGRTVGGDTIFNTASYDYDAPVSEYLGLTAKFYTARRHHLFLETLGTPLAQVLADALPGGPQVLGPAAVAGRGEAGSGPYRSVKAGPSAPTGWERFSAVYLNNPSNEGQTHQVFIKEHGLHLQVEVEAGAIKPIFVNLPLFHHRAHGAHGDPADLTLAYHTGRILGFWPGADADTLILYGREGERGELGILGGPAGSPAHRISYWITDRPTLLRHAVNGRELRIVLLTQARAERCWPTAEGWLIGPHLAVEDGGALDVDPRGIHPFYTIDASGSVVLLPNTARSPAPPPVTWGPEGTNIAWSNSAPIEQTATQGWQALEWPRSLETLGCELGYGWYRAELELDAPLETALAAPSLADRARVLLDGQDIGWLGVDPAGPALTVPLRIPAGRHELRLLVDNLGRFNYGANTGEPKGLLDQLYLGGAQYEISEGWSALWQEAPFAGEAIAGAKPGNVRADASDVRLDAFAYQGPTVWLLRDIRVAPGQRALLYILGDRNAGSLFVNGQNLARFSRHNGGGYLKHEITQHLDPDGGATIALNIQGYAGLPWRAWLLTWPYCPLQARWSFRAHALPGADAPAAPAGPRWWRGRFPYAPEQHGHGPFRLTPHGLRKGQIWLNGRNVGRYWQTAGPQEFYKLPASWLRPENELLLFEEQGGAPEAVWIGPDPLGAVPR